MNENLRRFISSKLSFKSFYYVLILVLVSVVVCTKNYTKNTFLTGWDTLHPEFNYAEYFKRIIDGAWQEHQSLGSVATQSHASEIPRLFILLLIDSFSSIYNVRYYYAFLMLIIGPLGVYFFIKKVILKELSDNASAVGAFCGGLFYLLNLGTLQHFVVPLEMFLTHFGFLGWSFLYLSKFMEGKKRSDLAAFSLINLLMVSQAHTATLFYAYFLFLVLYGASIIFVDLIKKKGTLMSNIAPYAIVLFITLLINSFWFGPNLYFGLEHGKEVQMSKIHHLFSEEAFLANKKYGNMKDTALIRNFLFDWGIYSGNGEYNQLLEPWIVHLKSPYVLFLGYLFFGFIVGGIVLGLINKNKYTLPISSMLLVGLFFIFNVNPPFGFLFRFFQEYVPLFKETFRFPFTKFSIVLILTYSVFFGSFFSYIAKFFSQIIKSKTMAGLIGVLLSTIVFVSIVYYAMPAFRGNFISPYMRVRIPTRYFELFDYFNNQDDYGRVLHLPVHTFWGWIYYNWDPVNELGYQGAGFLWFGIKQPLIDREFDRWNILNEQPYREISTAVYSENAVALNTALEKYKIRWILFDESVIAPTQDQTLMFYPQLEKVLSTVEGLSLEKDFGKGLKVYKYSPEKEFSHTEIISSFAVAGNDLFKEYSDPIYKNYGNYISSDKKPFAFLGINGVDENILDNYVVSNVETVSLVSNSNLKVSGLSNQKVPLAVNYARSGGEVVLRFDYLGSEVSRMMIPVSSNSDNLILRIGSELFLIQNETKNQVLGDVFFDFSNQPELSLLTVDETVTVSRGAFSGLESCSVGGKEVAYSISMLVDGFSLSGRNSLVCVTSSLNSLLGVSDSTVFSVSMDSNEVVNDVDICVLNNKTGLCTDYFLSDKKSYFYVNDGLDSFDLRFFADTRNRSSDYSKTFRNIKLDTYKSIFTQKLSFPIPNDETNIESGFTFIRNPSLVVYPSEEKGNRRACSIENSLGQSYFEESREGVVFNSQKDSLCDSYAFPTVAHNTGILLEIRAKNIYGVPLRICLTNEYSKRCDMDVSLPQSNSMSSYYFLVPPMDNQVGYTVNISNLVFGDAPSKNELESISIIPVPYDLIKSVTTENIEIIENKDIFVLNEAFEKGWIAFCGISRCNADHIMINNWANGWVFEKGQVPQNIKVFFWPQLLEYFGLLLTFILFVLLLIKDSFLEILFKDKNIFRKNEKTENLNNLSNKF